MYLTQIQGVESPSTIFTDHRVLLGQFVSRLLLYAIPAAGFVFLIIIIISGFTLLTSVGEPAKVQSAGKTLTNGIVGLLLVVSAYFILQLFETVFGIRITNFN